jgi:hypothetical protein
MGVSTKKATLLQSSNNQTSDSLRLHFLDFQITHADSIAVTCVIQSFAEQVYNHSTPPLFLNVTCEEGEEREYTKACPTGPNTFRNISIRCEGVPMMHSLQCPLVEYTPVCLQPDSLGKNFLLFDCNVSSYDSISTTCECVALDNGRRLSSTTSSLFLEVWGFLFFLSILL